VTPSPGPSDKAGPLPRATAAVRLGARDYIGANPEAPLETTTGKSSGDSVKSGEAPLAKGALPAGEAYKSGDSV
jgi:hypothetical protein